MESKVLAMFWLVGLIGGIILFIRFIVLLLLRHRKILRAFAEEYGYTYTKRGDINEVSSTYLQAGHSRRIINQTSGTYSSHSIRFFDFRSVVGYGKHQRMVYFSVFEITCMGNLRKFLLLSRRMRWSSGNLYDGLRNAFGKRIKLEGDFNKYFNLYVPEDYEIEAFQVFTPDVMAMFIDNASRYSFEFTGNKIYIYSPKVFYKKSKLEEMHNLTKLVIDKLATKLERI